MVQGIFENGARSIGKGWDMNWKMVWDANCKMVRGQLENGWRSIGKGLELENGVC